MRRKIVSRILALVISFSLGALQAAEFPMDQHVLVIYGNTDIGPWEQEFNSTILRLLATENAIPVIPEFLSLVGTDPAEFETFANSLRVKYGSVQIDLIIVVQPEANTFVHAYADYFAPDAKIIYVLPGTDLLSSDDFVTNNFIVASAVGVASIKTVEAITRMFPNLERLYVVGGVAAGDQSFTELIRIALSESEISEKVEYLIGLSMPELIARLGSAPEQSAILMSTYDRDSIGTVMRTMAVSQLLADQLQLPIFTTFDSLLQSGAIGGNLTSSIEYANSAVQLALAVLSEDEIPEPVITGSSEFRFDGTRLGEFNIRRNQLPVGSIIVNEELGFWNLYWRWALFGISFIAAQLILILYLISSIRRRKRLEYKMLELQKHQALGDLAGGIAHDFNNILMVLIANTDLAFRSIANADRLEKYLGNIKTATKRARDLVKQILAFSSGIGSANFECKNPFELLNETVGQLRTFLPETCQIELDCPDTLDSVNIDESQMSQALLNICVNAQHAMNDRGKILITAQNVSVRDHQKLYSQNLPPGNYVAIAISDTGTGIDSKHINHIFEPFYSTKAAGEGTGLGLPMVYRVVKLHEGYIDVQTRKSQGSKFTIYLPAVDNHTPSQKLPDLSDRFGFGRTRVMLVDDDEMVLDGTANMLTELGCDVTKFQNPVVALAEFRKAPDKYELLLTDLTLPEMDGIRLIASVRAIRKDIRVVLYTGYKNTVANEELQGITVLNKPASIGELSEALARSESEL